MHTTCTVSMIGAFDKPYNNSRYIFFFLITEKKNEQQQQQKKNTGVPSRRYKMRWVGGGRWDTAVCE